jgi:hypothetical protein
LTNIDHLDEFEHALEAKVVAQMGGAVPFINLSGT